MAQARRRKTLSDAGVDALRPRPARYSFPDPEMAGLFIRVTPQGVRTYVCQARNPHGRQVWHTIGRADQIDGGIEAARAAAKAAIARIKKGQPAVEAPRPEPAKLDSFRDVAERYLEREARAKGFLTVGQTEHVLKRYCYPTLGDRPFAAVRRGDVARLLDMIHDPKTGDGGRMADRVASVIHSVQTWYADYDDDYEVPPLPRKRGTPGKGRSLTHAEIKALWNATGDGGTYSGILRMMLLTGHRETKVAGMSWRDVDLEAGTWHVPQGEREKAVGGLLHLPELALAVLRKRQAVTAGSDFVFPGRAGSKPFVGWATAKVNLDKKLNIGPWKLHWLRHTASTLMAEEGVRPDVKELTIGHTRKGVEGRYDHSTLTADKAKALRMLAAAVERIVGLPPSENNVVQLRA